MSPHWLKTSRLPRPSDGRFAKWQFTTWDRKGEREKSFLCALNLEQRKFLAWIGRKVLSSGPFSYVITAIRSSGNSRSIERPGRWYTLCSNCWGVEKPHYRLSTLFSVEVLHLFRKAMRANLSKLVKHGALRILSSSWTFRATGRPPPHSLDLVQS